MFSLQEVHIFHHWLTTWPVIWVIEKKKIYLEHLMIGALPLVSVWYMVWWSLSSNWGKSVPDLNLEMIPQSLKSRLLSFPLCKFWLSHIFYFVFWNSFYTVFSKFKLLTRSTEQELGLLILCPQALQWYDSTGYQTQTLSRIYWKASARTTQLLSQ